MNINEFLNHLEILYESGIRIPKGTHAAKIIHHEDFDGVFSAIIAYRQLLAQEIKSQHIRIEGIQYGDMPNKVEKKLSKSKGQMVVLVDFARIPEDTQRPDFWTDHHSSEITKGAGGGRIGASEFRSDTEHLATIHTNNMVDGNTVEIVSKVDSAGYTDLREVLKLPKDFKSARRLERLGIICNALLTKSGILKNNSLLEDFIKKTKPSIVSFYNNILEYVKLDEIQKEAIEEIQKENPDWKKIEKARNLMPTLKSKTKIQKESINEDALSDYEELKKLKNKKRTSEEEKRYRELVNKPIDTMRTSRTASIEKERSGEGSFVDRGIALIQHNPRLQRYIWTQMNKAGIKYPFVIKRYGTMIQVSINPEIPKEVKEKIDLNTIANDVMDKIKQKFQHKYNRWAFKIIEKESGGHKGITNIAGLGTLGIMRKKDREELKYLKTLEDRVKKLKKRKLTKNELEQLDKAEYLLKKRDILNELDKEYYTKLKRTLDITIESLMPKTFKRLQELKDKKEKEAEKRSQIIDEIQEEFLKILKENFGDIKLTGGEKEYEFENLKNLFSSILD